MKRSSSIAGALAALALAGGLTVAIPGTARADGIVPNQPWTEVVPAFTDHLACLDDPAYASASPTMAPTVAVDAAILSAENR